MKFALVTGATKGIGKAIAHNMLVQGYHVILNYANDDATATDVYDSFNRQFGGQVSLIKQDLSTVDNIAAFADQLKQVTNSLDALIFNVGRTDRASIEEMTYESWKSVFDANLTVPFFIIQKLLPVIAANGSILFTGSSMGEYPHSLSVSYGVSKAAVHALVKNLIKFLSPRGIRINAVVPGFVETEWQAAKPVEIRKSIESKIALGRFCAPEEVADACAFLINNTYMNGELLAIDGGYSFK